MQIYPERYDPLALTPEERSFLRTVERAFPEAQPAYYVPRINPRKRAAGEGAAELFHLLLLPEGIFLFRFLSAGTPEVASAFAKSLALPGVYDRLAGDIRARLEGNGSLTGRDGRLRYALNIFFVIPALGSSGVEPGLTPEELEFCRAHLLWKGTLTKLRKKGGSVLLHRMHPGDRLTEGAVNHIFQRLCPELTIPRRYSPGPGKAVSAVDGGLEAGGRAVRSYRLDDRQINLVNRIARGNQLILACAGSGKSVLLISKCFRLAALNPGEEFLLTCYNRNLYHYYQWAIAQAGFTNRNVRCATFFGLCRQLLADSGVPFRCGGVDFDRMFETAEAALADGRITKRFCGVFIDEIQIFRPEWYRFCFHLLKDRDAAGHFFVIAGDKSQDIRHNIRSGRAPWQGGGAEYPEYRGKTLTLDRNYRNSLPIQRAVDRLVEAARAFGARVGADLTSDPELFLQGKAHRPGNEPTLVELRELSNEGEARAISGAVKALIREKGLSEVDIAILFYNKSSKLVPQGWQSERYDLLPALRACFDREGWEPPAVLTAAENGGADYGSRRGVTVATVEGSLGLDFRGVVLAGLRPLGAYEHARGAAELESAEGEERAKRLEAYQNGINVLYTGCTRARDELTVILSAPRGESVYLDLLRQAMGTAPADAGQNP